MDSNYTRHAVILVVLLGAGNIGKSIIIRQRSPLALLPLLLPNSQLVISLLVMVLMMRMQMMHSN